MSPELSYFIGAALYLIGFLVCWKIKNPVSGIISILINLIGLLVVLMGKPEFPFHAHWFSFGNVLIDFELSFQPISYLMLIFVQLISLIVQVFSLKYLSKDSRISQYYSILNLFILSMLFLVVSDNLLQLFFFWELVGFSSYLIIGFWFKSEKSNKAALKAFLYNKVGDVFFLLAIIMALFKYQTLSVDYISGLIQDPNLKFSFLLGLFFIIGALAKSAQFPLHSWLPDAMAGPTPASALIHAATMVAAGVFLINKIYFGFNDDHKFILSLIGSFTALIAASKAIFQYDIKKVLAFSTISQLGFMFSSFGGNNPAISLLHLGTHGFFKAGLFLCAGAILYYLKDDGDLRKMGNLKSQKPILFWLYILCFASIIALPLTSGFLSKDFLIMSLMSNSSRLPFVLLIVSSLLTSLYMTRHLILIFFGKNEQNAIKENPGIFELCILILALPSFYFFFSSTPFSLEGLYLKDQLNIDTNHHSTSLSIFLTALSLIGVYFGFWYVKKEKDSDFNLKKMPGFILPDFNIVVNKLIVNPIISPQYGLVAQAKFIETKLIDGILIWVQNSIIWLADASSWIEEKIIDRLVNGIASFFTKIGSYIKNTQGNKVQDYIAIILGIVVLYLLILNFIS